MMPSARVVSAALVVVTVLGFVLGSARSASAQAPWPDEIDELDAAQSGPIVEHARPPGWTLELKAGPYHPHIDQSFRHASGLPSGQGPFDSVYGARPMPLFLAELDHYVVFAGGGLGVSLAAGYTYRAASGFELDGNGDLMVNSAGQPLRYAGYRTVFRFYPITTGVVYRLTWLDDQLGIPVVPYAKLGLAGYVWQFLRPSRNLDGILESPACRTGPCLADRTRGMTLGWQWTLGLSVRLDMLDRWSARDLREDGIHHAAVFAELVGARVDDFGANDALDVGDTTWFAGMNVEF
jgi:hypothetical protein